jgi:RNA polymerase sigma-70 factor, ECF subfamily
LKHLESEFRMAGSAKAPPTHRKPFKPRHMGNPLATGLQIAFRRERVTGRGTLMKNESSPINRSIHEESVTERFFDTPDELSFTDLFQVLTPQLLAFFRTRGCGTAVAEDLTQEVMLTVHLKASQLRERNAFRAWLFKIARNTLNRHYRKQSSEIETVDLAEIAERLAASHMPAATPAFEFRRWTAFLSSREQELLRLRFIEQWEYHEIAAAHAVPIGTVQWRVFNAQKKLAPYLKARLTHNRQAA